MRLRRIVLGGLAAAAIAAMGAGPAAALAVGPAPGGGVQVDLTHHETAQVATGSLPDTVAGLPHPSAASFGATLRSAAVAATTLPAGRVSFTIVGPLDNLGGVMDVHEW